MEDGHGTKHAAHDSQDAINSLDNIGDLCGGLPDIRGPPLPGNQPSLAADAGLLEDNQSPKSTSSQCSVDTVIHVGCRDTATREEPPVPEKQEQVGRSSSLHEQYRDDPAPEDQPSSSATVPLEQEKLPPCADVTDRSHAEEQGDQGITTDSSYKKQPLSDTVAGCGRVRTEEGLPSIYVSQFPDDTDVLLQQQRNSPPGYDNQHHGQINLGAVQRDSPTAVHVNPVAFKLQTGQTDIGILPSAPAAQQRASHSSQDKGRDFRAQPTVDVKPKGSTRVVFSTQHAVTIIPEKLEEPDHTRLSRAVCYLIWSVLGCACCFWPLGTPAIVFASLAVSAARRGHYDKAEQNENVAMWLTVAAMIVGVFVLIVLLCCVIIPTSYN